MLDRKSVMQEIHGRAKKAFKSIFRKGKSYAQILGEEISNYWRTAKIVKKMAQMSVEQMESFYQPYKAIN